MSTRNSELIRAAADEAGLSRVQLAELCRVSVWTVDAWFKPATSKSHCEPGAATVELLFLKLRMAKARAERAREAARK